ncbi:MAG: tRNA epoxyqueuosine(34) reductase QueG [Nitrospirota bacterium]|nr:MAG: tRNA epoxyqueuosine(34) reductase QueG [Nitrospirota bacterium]
MPTLTETIKQKALELGFDAVGVTRVPPGPPRSTQDSNPTNSENDLQRRLYTRLLEWLSHGFHGTMEWMAHNPERRSNPQAILPGCKSLISLGMNYYSPQFPNEAVGYGRIARYAWGEDYHRLFKRKLKRLESAILDLRPQSQTRRYADTGPVMEKAWAQQAGLGWIGKHSNLVSTEFGSWLLLGEILTTLELDPDEPTTDLCGSCSLCIQACPTGAITEPYVVDAEKCISYLTIEFRGGEEEISEERKYRIGNRIFGCDDCLDICPFNVHAQSTKDPAFQSSSLTLNPHLNTLLTLTEESFREHFQHSPIRRAKYEGFRRNISIAQNNSKRKPPLTSIQRS